MLDERVGRLYDRGCATRLEDFMIEGVPRTAYTVGGLGVLYTAVKKSAND